MYMYTAHHMNHHKVSLPRQIKPVTSPTFLGLQRCFAWNRMIVKVLYKYVQPQIFIYENNVLLATTHTPLC